MEFHSSIRCARVLRQHLQYLPSATGRPRGVSVNEPAWRRSHVWQADTHPAQVIVQTRKLRRRSTLDLHLLEEDAWQLHATRFEFFCESRTDTGGLKATNHLALPVYSGTLELEDLLHGDSLAFHAGDLGNRSHATGAVREPGDLDHQIDCGSDLLPHRAIRQSHSCHLDHGFQTGQSVPRSVRVNRG